MIEADFAIMHKTRPAHDEVAITEITGGVRDKIAIVGDDVITTGGTLLAGATTLREHGATRGLGVRDARSLLGAEALERWPLRRSRASSSPTRCRSTRCTDRRT